MAKNKDKEFRARLKLSDEQYNALDIHTRRSMLWQLIFIDTDHYRYSIGANGSCYIAVRRDRLYGDTFAEEGEVVDAWA